MEKSSKETTLLNQLDSINKKLDIINKKREAITDKLVEINIPKFKQYIGKCFKFNNSHGCDADGKPLPKWWLYKKITDINSVYWSGYQAKILASVFYESFEHTSDNEFDFKEHQDYYLHSLINGDHYIEITPEEYNTEKQKFFHKIKDALIIT